mgnify:CR=1
MWCLGISIITSTCEWCALFMFGPGASEPLKFLEPEIVRGRPPGLPFENITFNCITFQRSASFSLISMLFLELLHTTIS